MVRGRHMKNPLSKRLLRELKDDFGKYAVIFLLLVFSIGLISGFLVADGSMIKAYTALKSIRSRTVILLRNRK